MPTKVVFGFLSMAQGGVTEVSLRLANALVRRGVLVRVLATRCEIEVPMGCVAVNVMPLDALLAELEELATGGWLVLSTSGRDTRVMVGAMRELSRRSLVHVQHVPLWLRDGSLVDNLVRVLAASFLFRRVLGVIAVSGGVRDDIIRNTAIRPHAVSVVPNCVLNRTSASVSSSPKQEPVFVFVGRLHFQKNVARMIEIFERVASLNPTIKLRIVGDGPDRMLAERAVSRAGVADRVTFLGWMKRREIEKELAGATAVLLTSRWEGLPTVLVEAAALGTPFIAVNCVAGPSELLDGVRGGVLVDYDDDEGFIRAALTAANDPDGFKRKHQPADSVIERFEESVAAVEFIGAAQRFMSRVG